MSIDALFLPLLTAELFEDLPPATLKQLAVSARSVAFDPGDLILHRNTVGDVAYLVAEGVVVTRDMAGNEHNEFGMGTMLGELAMFCEVTHMLDVVAKTPVRTLAFRREDMTELLTNDQAVARHFHDVMQKRVASVAQGLRDLDSMLARLESAA